MRNGCVLWELLETFRDSLCKEIHDKVYGFLGLSSDCDAQRIPVDYLESVFEIYEDVMRFYHSKFRGRTGIEPPLGAQLARLSEFLQELLGLGHRSELAPPFACPMPRSSVVEISATRVFVIEGFLDAKLAAPYRASDLAEFLQGTIPYSHLGHWRGVVSPDVGEVYAIRNSQAALLCHVEINQAVAISANSTANASAVARNKRVFYARPPTPATHIASAVRNRYVIGICPEGSQLGDVACTFLESRLAKVFRPTSATTHALNEPGYGGLHGGGFVLVGRAVLDLSSDENLHPYRALLNPDKTVDVVHVQTDTTSDWEQDPPWPATVSIDLETLLLVTRPETHHHSRGFAKAKLTLLPEPHKDLLPAASVHHEIEKEGKNRSTTEPAYKRAGRINNEKVDDELRLLCSDPQLRKHALVLGRAGIVNLGSTGYLSSTLQILYMLKPIREVGGMSFILVLELLP
jgi:hypothetical protein